MWVSCSTLSKKRSGKHDSPIHQRQWLFTRGQLSTLAEHDHHPSGVYRGHKADIFEGGHRVPLIIRWPGKIRPKTQSKHLVCHTDLYPTLEAISGQKPQKQGGEDGFSLLPIFTDQGPSKRDSLISHSIDGSFAIRQGDWKLCLSHGSGGWSAPKEASAKKQGLPALQLYHLGLDVKESHNLVKNYPARRGPCCRF